MTMELSKRARSSAGAFLLLMLMFVAGLVLGATPASAAERLRFALEREGGACPPAPAADAPPAEQAGWTLGLIRLNGKLPEGSNLAGCVLHLRLGRALRRPARGGRGRRCPRRTAPPPSSSRSRPTRSSAPSMPSSGSRRLFAEPPVRDWSASIAPASCPRRREEELAPYVDAVVRRPGEAFPAETSRRQWLRTSASATLSPTAAALGRSRGRAPRDARRRRARRPRRLRERRPRALPPSALFHGGLVPGPDRDPRDPAGRLRGEGRALLRRKGVHAHPASARGSRGRGPHRALGRAVLASLRGKSRVRRPPRLRAQERAGSDARRVPGLARRGPHAGGARGRRDQGGRRRRSGAGPDGRRDHRPRAGMGGRPEREVQDLHGEHGYVAHLPRRRVPELDRPDDPGPVLLGARKAARLAVERVLPERRPLEGPHDPQAADPRAGQGHDAAARHPPDRGIRLRARRRDRGRRTAGLRGRLPPEEARSPTSPSTAAGPGSTARPSRSSGASPSSSTSRATRSRTCRPSTTAPSRGTAGSCCL